MDLSSPILEWLSLRPSLGSFSALKMEVTRFVDLDIRIGFPYLYVHAGSHVRDPSNYHFFHIFSPCSGDCEHHITFLGVRSANPSDPPRSRYPFPLYLRPIPRKRCGVCDTHFGVFVTFDDVMAPSSPCLFCHTCFFRYVCVCVCVCAAMYDACTRISLYLMFYFSLLILFCSHHHKHIYTHMNTVEAEECITRHSYYTW